MEECNQKEKCSHSENEACENVRLEEVSKELQSHHGVMRYGKPDATHPVSPRVTVTPSSVVTAIVFFASAVHTLNLVF